MFGINAILVDRLDRRGSSRGTVCRTSCSF